MNFKLIIPLFFILFSGCNGVGGNKKSEVSIAEENGKQLIQTYFKEFDPVFISKSNAPRYSILIYSVKNISKNNMRILINELEEKGWVLKENGYGKFFCNNERTILEVVEPINFQGKHVESLVAIQESTEWRIGYSYRVGGMDECLASE